MIPFHMFASRGLSQKPPFQHGSGVPSLSSNSHRRAWLVDGIAFKENQIVLAQELHYTQNQIMVIICQICIMDASVRIPSLYNGFDTPFCMIYNFDKTYVPGRFSR